MKRGNKKAFAVVCMLSLLLANTVLYGCSKNTPGNDLQNSGAETTPLTPPAAYSEGLEYTLSDDGTYYILTGIGTCSDTEIVIPAVHEGLPVEVIGDRVFSDHEELTNITIPDSITDILEFAFSGCSGLTEITILDSVMYIGQSAFYRCTGLTEITIPRSVMCIDGPICSACTGLTSITVETGNPIYRDENNCLIETDTNTLIFGCKRSSIPQGVTSIGADAFAECTELTHITIPRSVTAIDAESFYGCSGLTDITVESGNPAYRAENNCLIETATNTLALGCKTSTIPQGIKKIGAYAFFRCRDLKSIRIPEGVTVIESRAFSACTGLTDVTIPDSVQVIGDVAFSGCRALKSIHIPDSVTEIGYLAIFGCWELESITVGARNQAYTGKGNCLIETATNTLISGCKNSVIPEGVKHIAEYAFTSCTDLKSIRIPGSVTSIGGSAFFECTGLTSLTIPNGVKSIGAFAFSGCTGLTSISFPRSLTSIGELAFFNYPELESITVENGNPVYRSQGNCLIESATNTLIFGCKNSIIPENIACIESHAFGCIGLTDIAIPKSVKSIGDYAFAGCTELRTIRYNGTRAEWEAVSKDPYWTYNTDGYTIICTDGSLRISGS